MWHDPKNKEYAKALRQNMTPWERRLWYCFLNTYPVRFQRQKCIDHYIVDFYCFRAKLVIELDGGGHYEMSLHSSRLQSRYPTLLRVATLVASTPIVSTYRCWSRSLCVLA